MYALSTEAKKDLQSYIANGTIGSVSFSDENILKGSLSISNQCGDNSTFNLGGVYIGQMKCTFINVNILRNDWIGKEITLSITINGEETIPVGVFYVDSAEHTKGMTSVTAYDAMNKFDKALDANTSTINDSAYNILSWLCSECGVTLGMTQGQVETLPNGTDTYFVSVMGDMETYRDVLYWMSQTLGGFATIDRSGHLVVRTYHSTVDDTIDYGVRYNNSRYGDEIVKFSGFYWVNEEDGTAEYEHSTPDDDYYITLGINPFFQSGLRTNYIDGILSALSEIEYNDCSVSIPFGIHYDLGDVLQFPNGQGSLTNKFCIISYTWNYYGEYKIKSIAVPKTSKNKSDKNITALMRKGSSDEIEYYLIANMGDIDIADGSYADIVDMYFASNTATVVMLNLELHCDIETSVVGDNYYDAVAQFKFYLNELEITNHKPVETWVDGKHIKHLLYYFTIQDSGTKRLRIRTIMNGGSLHIDMGNLRGALSGQKLVASDKWNGIVKINEEATSFNIPNALVFSGVNDSVIASAIQPIEITPTEQVSAITLSAFTFNTALDTLTVNEIIPNRITENGKQRYTEDEITRKVDG